MTEEEKKAAEAKAIADKAIADKAKEEAEAQAKAEAEAEAKVIAEKDEKIAQLEKERDNYKNVALKRLGKLPGDAEFVDKDGTGLSVAEQVRLALLDRELQSERKAKEDLYAKTLKENSELKLALKNRPGGSIGSEGGTVVDVKDNIFSTEQLEVLRKKAIALKADPEKFIESAKQKLRR